MSLATAVGQVIFSQKSGVYMPAIMCDKGDLYQEYNGDSSNPVDISPDFTTLLPVLSFVLTSSRVAEGLVVPSSMKWYFNDTELTFGSDKVSTNSFSGETGHFEFINYQAGVQNYYALRIKKNLVKAAGAALYHQGRGDRICRELVRRDSVRLHHPHHLRCRQLQASDHHVG